MSTDAMARPIPILCSAFGVFGSCFVTLTYTGMMSLSYSTMKSDVQMKSNIVMPAGGIWKLEMVLFMTAPCSMKRVSI